MIPLILWLVTADIDWELVLAIAMGLGAAAVAVLEFRRTSRLDEHSEDFAAQQAASAATIADAGMRLARLEELVAVLTERVAYLEAASRLAERIAVLEARADHQPWKHTRKKNGQFGSPLAGEDAT